LSAVSTVPVATAVEGNVSGTASVVDVSSLSQTLATTIALLEQQMKAIATSGSAAPIGDAATNFATTASLANMFVKAFNTFQSGNVNSIQNPLTSFLDSSLLDAMGGVLADSGNNLLESLSKIGITLDTSLSADNTQFSLDTVVLQKHTPVHRLPQRPC
jgi:outer membrane murein-binding lipoprotein Lpp